MIRHLLTATIASVTAAATLSALWPIKQAEACSPPLEGQVDEFEPIVGIPTRGVVPFRVTQFSPTAFTNVTVVVTDSAGAEIAGTTTVEPGRLVWRSLEPLLPLTTYNARIDDQWQLADVQFTTADNDDPRPLLTELSPVRLVETFEPSDYACCEGEDSSCGQTCFRIAYDRYFVASTSVLGAAESLRYQTVTVTAPNGSAFGNFYSARFDDVEAASFCMDIAIRSLLDGAESEQRLCVSAASLELAAGGEPEPDNIDGSQCDGPLTDSEGNSVDSGGCQVSSFSGAGSALWLLALLFGISRRRRRR